MATPRNAPTAATVNRAALEEVEHEHDDRLPFLLTFTEVKLLGIAGVGFFLDAYDLFIINPVSTMLQYRLYKGKSIPSGIQGFLKAGANIGSVIGQVTFGYLGDAYGRKAVYGKELMIIILATILCISTPTGTLSPYNCIVYLGCFRILLGIGVGGDYPMSASVTSDRSNVRRRGTMLGYIFANQGWGSFVGAIVFIVVLQCYKHVMNDEGKVSKVDGVWRICVGLSLIPAFGTLYQRLTLPESTRYERSQELADIESDNMAKEKAKDSEGDSDVVKSEAIAVPESKKAHVQEFIHYMSEWRHLKILIGTAACWFLVDIAFYGINLNQNVVLQQIGYDGKTGSTDWEKLHRLGVGNLIITALGFVPGYYVTILTVEYLGRWNIQFFGFLLEALFLGILAGNFHHLKKGAFIALFTLLQFFFNFGANATTFLYPAEVFPTRFRAFGHGLSAACGKVGAIISALVFNTLTNHIGTPGVLWIFFGCSLGGAVFTWLLPEVKGRDPDLVYEEELREGRIARGH